MLKTKFRRIKCVCYAGSEYEAIKDCAITEDGKKHIIQTMKDGTEYFTIDNPYRTDLMGRAFIGCIADAVQSIREDYADVLLYASPDNLINHDAHPIILIDREKGETYRTKFKEGWKDAKFGWGIEYGNKNSFAGYHLADENGKMAWNTKAKVYATKEDAEEQLNIWRDEAITIAEKFKAAIEYGDKSQEKAVLDKIPNGIIKSLFFDMIKIENNNVKINTNIKELDNVGYDIVQSIYPKD